MRRVVCAVILCVLALPTLAAAQERGQVGVTMGFPSAIGLQWHATDRLAIRPEISFAYVKSETESDFFDATDENIGKNLAFGVSAIWYMRPATDNIRPYLSPRVAYNRLSSDDDDDEDPRVTSAWSASGSFGVQYTPARRFAIFGEAGFGRTSSEIGIDTVLGSISSTTTSWSTRTAVGVIVYFGG